MLETGAESRALKIAVEDPTVRQLVHFLATWTPVRIATISAAQFAADLAHFCRFQLISVVAAGTETRSSIASFSIAAILFAKFMSAVSMP